MSFMEQERALLDLIFNTDLQTQFASNPMQALAKYQLSDNEQRELCAIPAKALNIDITLRRDLILAQLCRQYPLTFSLLSAFDGLALLPELINSELMRAGAIHQASLFGQSLNKALVSFSFPSEQQKNHFLAVLNAETSMAFTSASLKENTQSIPAVKKSPDALPDNWKQQKLTLAPFLSANLLPQPYQKLRSALCPCFGAELWRHLGQQPTDKLVGKQLLEENLQPILFLAKAHSHQPEACDPTVEHTTAELSPAFAPLLQHINGQQSLEQLLQSLGDLPANTLEQAANAFEALIKAGILLPTN